MKEFFYGTPQLMRFTFRKERVLTFVWLGALLFLSVFVAIAYGSMTFNAGGGMTALWTNPAVVAMLGPIFGEASPGSLYASSMILTMVIATAIMNISFVIRNTRAEEEKGLGEVVRSLPVGRLANLAAVLMYAALANVAVAALLALGLCGFYGSAGAAVFGLAVGASGIAFAAIAAVFANFSASKSTASGMSLAAVLLFYMLRAVGDVSAEPLSFFSPVGLAARTQPMAGNVLWPLAVLTALSAALAASAFYLNSVRDFGRGILAEKHGRRIGGFLMRFPEGLLFKLTRKGMLFWVLGLFMLGASYGVVMGETESFLETIQAVMPSVTDIRMFILMITMMTALVASVPALAGMLKLAGEEKNGRYEQVFAGSVSKNRMMSLHFCSALIQSFAMILAAMLGLWLTSSIVMDDPIAFGEMFAAFAVYLPATWVTIGLCALLVALWPKRAALVTYGYFGISFCLLYFGQLAGLPKAVSYATPFGFVPQIPVDPLNPWTLCALTAVAAALTAAAFLAYKKRDLVFSE